MFITNYRLRDILKKTYSLVIADPIISHNEAKQAYLQTKYLVLFFIKPHNIGWQPRHSQSEVIV